MKPRNLRFYAAGLICWLTFSNSFVLDAHAEKKDGPLKKPSSKTSHFNQNQQRALIKGQVVDINNLPLPGVNIKIEKSNVTTASDKNGNFEITANINDALVFTAIGFTSKRIVVENENAKLKVVLEEENNKLNEVVVVGYGVQKKANLTGAVSQIDSKMLENRPTANLGQALQGVMPNFNVNISNGSPNTSASYNIRGATSFFKDKNDGNKIKFSSGQPFTLVDGIEMDPNQLNPEDIESVTLLKDAASAAIYGARGAFGVLLIKTKSGKGGQIKVNYSNSFQWSSPTAVPDILDAYTIQEASIKASELEGISAGSNEILKLQKIKEYMDDPVNNEPYYFADADVKKTNILWRGNVNPYKEALLKSSPMQKHNLSLSGGNEKTSFYGSFGYQDQDGLYKINTDNFKRYNALLNVSSKVNDWFKMDYRTAFNSSTYIEPVSPSGKGGWWTAMSQEPNRNVNMPIHVPTSLNLPQRYTDNILSFMEYGSSDKETKSNILLAAAPTITFTKDWSLKGDFSYLSNSNTQKIIVPRLERLESTVGSFTAVHTDPDYVSRYNFNSNKYTVNIFTDYAKTIADKHNFHGTVGFNQEWYTDQSVSAQRNMINSNVPVLGQAQGERTVGDSEQEWAVRGVFYRFTYNYDGKYLFESNGRYDGTSRFPSDIRYKFFPSFSAGWRVSEESFAKGIKPYINDFKLRASYGSLGNQNVANYIYILNYGTNSQLQYLLNGVRPVGVTPPGLVDPDLTWETATTIDFGFDLTAFKNFEINFDWYRRRTSDILIDGLKFPSVLGASSPTRNSATIDTKGWELTMKYRNTTGFGLNYDLGLTLGDSQAEVVKFANNPNKLLSDQYLYEGQKMGEIWGYETYGIFQTKEEITNSPTQKLISSGLWFPGDVRYKDIDGNNEINFGNNTVGNSGDRKIIGNSTPRYQFGFNSNFSYKNVDLDIFVQGVGKRDLWIGNNLYWGAGTTGTWETYNNSWTPERTDAFYPAYKNASRNRQVQTRYLENGAYLRMKNLALGYTLPRAFTEKIKLQRVRLSASAYNLFEFKSVPKTFDPELVGMNYPIIRSYAFGLQATF